MTGQRMPRQVSADLWRVKQERNAARAALEMTQAALELTRLDLFSIVARGRLKDEQILWTSGIASKVITLDGRVDRKRLDSMITRLITEHPEVAAPAASFGRPA